MPRLNPHFPFVVGLCAAAPQSGKTTVADHLVKTHGYVNVPNSGLLKQMLTAFSLSSWDMTGEAKETPHVLLGGKSPRYLLQSLGQWVEKEANEAWEIWWEHIARDVIDHGAGVVQDSVRRQAEIDHIRRMGGVVIKIIRPNGALVSDHPAEKHELNADYTVINGGSIGCLYGNVERVLTLHGM